MITYPKEWTEESGSLHTMIAKIVIILNMLPRPKGADEARIIGRQDLIQNTFELCPTNTA